MPPKNTDKKQKNLVNPLSAKGTIGKETPPPLTRSTSKTLLTSIAAQGSTTGVLVRRQSTRQLATQAQVNAYSDHYALAMLKQICTNKQLQAAALDLSGTKDDPDYWKVQLGVQFCTPVINSDPRYSADNSVKVRTDHIINDLITVFNLLGTSHLQQGKNMIYAVKSQRYDGEVRVCVEREVINALFKQDPDKLREKIQALENSKQNNNDNVEPILKNAAITIGNQVANLIEAHNNLGRGIMTKIQAK